MTFSKLNADQHVNAPRRCFPSNDSCNVNNSRGSHPKRVNLYLPQKGHCYSTVCVQSFIYNTLFLPKNEREQREKNKTKRRTFQQEGVEGKVHPDTHCGSGASLIFVIYLLILQVLLQWGLRSVISNII